LCPTLTVFPAATHRNRADDVTRGTSPGARQIGALASVWATSVGGLGPDCLGVDGVDGVDGVEPGGLGPGGPRPSGGLDGVRPGGVRGSGPAAQARQRDHGPGQAERPGEQERPVEPGGRRRVHDLVQSRPLARWPAGTLASSRWAWPPETAWATAGRPPRSATP
jgi:hypothetical protein